MSAIQALKGVSGASTVHVSAVSVGGNDAIFVPHGVGAVQLTGTPVVTYIFADGGPGRLLTVIGSADGSSSISSSDTGGVGEIDTGAFNTMVDAGVSMVLRKTETESWEMIVNSGVTAV